MYTITKDQNFACIAGYIYISYIYEEVKMKLLSQFALELRHSGYDVQFRKYVIDHAIIKYNKALIEHMNGTKCMFRNKTQREEDTKAKGGKKNKESWYKCSGRYTSTMVIPLTSGGCL